MTGQFDSKEFRSALGSFATGVTIVTTLDGQGRPVGLTANSFNSVSLDPPMVLWSLARSSRNHQAFQGAEHFAVHVLAADQEPLSSRFAKSGADKFAGEEIERGFEGIPLLAGCSARFQCRTVYRYEGGDHTIFVGEVVAFDRSERPPLLFHSGSYAIAAKKVETLAAEKENHQPPGSFGENFLGYLLGRAHYQLYGRLEGNLRKHGLDAYDHFILSVLGIEDGRTAETIEELIGYTGAQVTPERVASLRERDMLRPDVADGDGAADRLWLSDKGKRTLVELTAAAKSAEGDALRNLDTGEVSLLKHLLKHVIRTTDPGLPDPWTVTSTDDSIGAP